MKFFQILANSTSPNDQNWGYLPYVLITLGNFVWTFAFIYTNQHNINIAEFTLLRGLTCLFINYYVCIKTDSSTEYKMSTTLKVLIIRSSVMSIHSLCFAIAQHILPLPIVHTISCTGTLFVFLFDYILNSIKITSKQAFGIVIGVFGALISTNGKVLTQLIDPTYQYSTDYQYYITHDNLVITIFSLLLICSMMIWAIGVVMTKWAIANTFQINFMLGLGLSFTGAIAYPYVENKASNAQLITSIFFTSIPMIIGQWLFIGALTMTKQTGVLNMFNFVNILFGYLISIFRYHESPNFITNIGIIFVFMGVWKTVFNKEIPKN